MAGPVKCKWYDDDGHPVTGTGCRAEHSGCTYVHPSNPIWGRAARQSIATVRGRGGGRGGAGRGFTSPTSRDSGWSNRRQSSGNSDWDSEAWKPKPGSGSSTAPEPSTSKVFGNWGSGDGGGKGNDWGNAGWGTGAASAAPPSPPEPSTSKVMQWGDPDGGWGGGGAGWGTSAASNTEPSASNAGDGGWGGGWGTSTASNAEPSTSNAGDGGWGGGGWGTSAPEPSAGKKSDGENATGDRGWGGGGWGNTSAIDDSTPFVPPSTQPMETQPPRAKDLWVNVTDKMAVDEPRPPLSASSYRAASQAPSERTTVCETPQSAFPPFAVPRSAQNMTRSEIHSGIIKNSVRVTRIQLELKELQRQLETWKTTQFSNQFERISKQAGEQLNGINGDLKGQIKAVNLRLKQAENELLRYPELPSCAPNPSPDIEKEMQAYTDQLAAWLKSFTDLAIPEPKPPLPADSDTMDVDADPQTEGPRSLFTEIQERTTNLEENLDEAEETVHDFLDSERNAAYVEKGIAAYRSRMNGGDQSQQKTGEDDGPVAILQNAANTTSEQLQSHAEQIALLLEKNDFGNRRIKALEKERDDHRRLQIAMQSQLSALEQRKEERAKQIALMTEQIARLGAHRRKPKAVLDGTVLANVQATVKTMIQDEVVPALQALGIHFTDAISRRVKSFEQSIQPAVDQTNEICQRATQIDA
ncbi:hypothetical protein C8R47DRAFT_795840 [Mycena vitilis]|nr:hypothetical protein C8R47DRAFT_795840 [Mycena vitilis]